jgi:predicted phage tail protein
MWRAVAAGTAVVAAAASGVVTALVTAHSAWGLWVALGVLVVIGAVLQVAVMAWKRRSARGASAAREANQVTVSGTDNIVARGNVSGSIHTGTQIPTDPPEPPAPAEGLGGDHRGD